MLTSIQIEAVSGVRKLTVNAPKLASVKIWNCGHRSLLRLDLVHVGSVEKLVIDQMDHMPVRKLKNLKFLYTSHWWSPIDPMLLLALERLKELHLLSLADRHVSLFFDQKQRYGCVQLKIYLCGLLLDGPNDPIVPILVRSEEEAIRCLADHQSRLADEIPLESCCYHYEAIESFPRGSEINFLNRFTDLDRIDLPKPVQDIERFLEILKNLDSVAELRFFADQPQALFDRLPEQCVVQKLTIYRPPANLDFLFKFKDLKFLSVSCEIDAKTRSTIFENNPFLSQLFSS